MMVQIEHENREVRIIGYAAKPTKVVVFISTEHHCKNIMLLMQDNTGFESLDKKLPEIINHYNFTDGR